MNKNFEYQSLKEEYKSQSFSLINRSFEWKDKQINIILEEAVFAMGQLNLFTKIYPEIEDFILYFYSMEAVASSRLEGNKADIIQLLSPNYNKDNPLFADQLELKNHVDTMIDSCKKLNKQRLSIKLIKDAHKKLYENIPNKYRFGGKLRLNDKNDSHHNLDFIPPSKTELKKLINDAKHFWRNDDLALPNMIKMAFSLYQFENILPFLDGNGKTARILILFEILSLGYLKYPILCISEFLERNKLEYYNRLSIIRVKNDIEQWIKFFLTAMKESAQLSIDILESLIKIKQEIKTTIVREFPQKGHKNAIRFIDCLINAPMSTIGEMSKKLKLSFQAVNEINKIFLKLNIVNEYSGSKRNRRFFVKDIMNLFYR
ncbi:MAG: Fic family protein [Marinifilaceae bacterium]|jgi:Fic family protein|nr:Fic family protein [Marinifilaceae bacterium]